MIIVPPSAAPTPGLLTSSYAYKPFRYPWAHEFWKKQQQVHWMPEECPSARTARTGRRT
jgi:ribonucleotide reductase beta subunit family protein with ferritin-like domain